MKLVGTSCKSHEIAQNSLGTQHAFYMRIIGKKSKEMQKDMLYVKKKIEFGGEQVERKLLVQEQLQ